MKKYSFQAKIESRGSGSYVLFPYSVEQEFGCKGRVPVKVTFDGVSYTGSLVKYGNPQHMMPMLKEIREKVGKGAGDTVAVELWKDDGERTVEIPPALQHAMKRGGVLGIFQALSYTHRREYCRWITEAKKEETRTKRIEKAVEMLKEGVKTPDGAGAATKAR